MDIYMWLKKYTTWNLSSHQFLSIQFRDDVKSQKFSSSYQISYVFFCSEILGGIKYQEGIRAGLGGRNLKQASRTNHSYRS